MEQPLLARLIDADLGYNKPVLEKFSLEIRANDFIAMVGPNGSGKSTVLKSLLGIIPLLKGNREILGVKNPNPSRLAGKISYIPQKVAVNRSVPISVREFFSLKLPQLAEDDMKIALKTVQLEGFEKRSLHQLSGGEFQRVMLAFSIVGKPSLVFLDEVAEGLDLKSQETFFQVIKNLMSQRSMAVLMISHDISAVSEATNRVVCINRSLLYDGSPKNPEFHSCLHKIYGEESLIHGHHHH